MLRAGVPAKGRALAGGDPGGPSAVFHVDALDGLRLRGWAEDGAQRGRPVTLHLLVDGQEIGNFVAELPRPDLGMDGLQPRRVGCVLDLPEQFADGAVHRIEMRDALRRDVPMVLGGEACAFVEFTAQAGPRFSGFVDGLRHGALEGWVVRGAPGGPGQEGGCVVRVACDGATIGHVRAAGHRGDVGRSLNGPANCGFRFALPDGFRSGRVRRFQFFLMPEDVELEGSPCVTSVVDDAAQRQLLELTEAVDAMHRELTRIRRQLHEMAPGRRWTIADYDLWFRAYEPALARRMAAARPADGWAAGPLVSIVCPVFRPGLADFKAAAASALGQTYGNIELILVDDGSRDKALSARLDALARGDARVRVIRNRRTLGISGATNVGVAAARGEWVAFFDHDDLLVATAVECMVSAALATGAAVLYSDEDLVDAAGSHVKPALKTGWNHRLLLGLNYVCHLLFVRRTALEAAGPLDSRYDGAQDHDLVLRLFEQVGAAGIHHVPEVLYHWRITPGSTAETVANKGYAVKAGRLAVSDHLVRIGRPGVVEALDEQTLFRVTWPLPCPPRVTIIIPFKDQIEVTERCLRAVLGVTEYPEFEVLLVDNWSVTVEAEAFRRRVGRLRRGAAGGVRILRVEEAFNYSRLNNLAAGQTGSEFLVFMNNDLFVTAPGWLRAIVGEAVSDPGVGAVGGKFFYPSGGIQHAGVVTGLGGVAGHVHVGLQPDDNGFGGRLLFTQELSAVTGAGMLVRASAFREVGGFDEVALKIAFNDVDLCLKLRRAGYRVIWSPEFVAEHHESLSRGDDERPMQETRFFDETETMKARWGEALDHDPFYHPKFSLDGQAFFDLRDPGEG